MHIFYKASVLACLAALSSPAWSQPTGCEAKRQEIEQQLAAAKAQGNRARVGGLESALANVKASCTDASLRRDAQDKVDKARQKLAERQRGLQEAKDEGRDAGKLADRQRKVDEARAELERAEATAVR
ncbi:DUF1090 domain-containing protein [Bordetella genomosp. 13]|uniref:DUF1090 domain-containing protein n=1 Tax=Bordetella genomosp. 13 TaxID=463040 RepID=UPI0011A754D1|nr:DUF1090 domain-containing protein [Bordetella genomosp. 13]